MLSNPALFAQDDKPSVFKRFRRIISAGLLALMLSTLALLTLPTHDVQAAEPVKPYTGYAYAFIRTPGPAGQGHIGWGYATYDAAINNWVFLYGAVEGNGSTPYIAPGQFNGGWYRICTGYGYAARVECFREMLRTFRGPEKQYTAYREYATFATDNYKSGQASTLAYNMGGRGYQLPGNTCLNAVYDVLAAIGVPLMHLPRPWIYPAPIDWYNRAAQLSSNWGPSINL